jgi:hypothetical protein
MRSVCLFAFVLFAVFSAIQTRAQSQSKKSDTPAVSPNAEVWQNSGGDLFRLSLDTQADLIPQTKEADAAVRVDAEEYQLQAKALDLASDRLSKAEHTVDIGCYSIRSYRVMRDNPHSDATHLVSYSTCVPATRLQLYRTVDSSR